MITTFFYCAFYVNMLTILSYYMSQNVLQPDNGDSSLHGVEYRMTTKLTTVAKTTCVTYNFTMQ